MFLEVASMGCSCLRYLWHIWDDMSQSYDS